MYFNLILIKKYIFNNVEIVEIIIKIVKEICKDIGELVKIKEKSEKDVYVFIVIL